MIARVTNHRGYTHGPGMPNPPNQPYGYGAPHPQGQWASPPPGYGPPPPPGSGAFRPPGDVGRPERIAPVARCLISVLLVVPTVGIYFVNSWRFRSDLLDGLTTGQAMWVMHTLLPLYFVAVVAVWARRGRRSAAVTIAVVTGLVDVVWMAVSLRLFGDVLGMSRWVYDAVEVLIFVGYVGAWGITRRRARIWAFGLILAVLGGAVLQWIYWTEAIDVYQGPLSWINAWALRIGVFVLCCLFCWAVDAASPGSRRAATPQFHDR